MFDRVVWDSRVERFRNYLDRLYFGGRLNLEELHSLRSVMDQISSMMNELFIKSCNFFMKKAVLRDMDRLNSEFLLLEYNVSLLSLADCA